MNSTRSRPTRIVAIDYGLARIGVAISDEAHIIATPLPNITVKKKSTSTLDEVIKVLDAIEQDKACSIERLVVGLPLQLNGKKGFAADEVRHFADLLSEKGRWPVVLWDERLTTVQAERSMRQAGVARKKRAQVVDGITAIIILQSYLDSLGKSLTEP